MKFLSLAATLALLELSSNAISLDMQPLAVETLVQTSADVDAEVDVDAEAEGGKGYGITHVDDPYYSDPHHDDCQYYCPPVLDKCPGVLQPPGPCKLALKERPLCYCNSGFMHTDWDHTVSVDDEPCDDCGKKNPHKDGYPPHPKKPHQGYPPKPKPGYPS